MPRAHATDIYPGGTCFLEIRYDNAAKVARFYPANGLQYIKDNTLCYLYPPLNGVLPANGVITLVLPLSRAAITVFFYRTH